MMKPQKRYEAEWIEKQHLDKYGEWNPDLDEYGVSYHGSKKCAEKAAVIASKKANACEWIMVSEQELRNGEWVDVRRWTGDWDNGSFQQTYSEESDAA